MRTYERTKNVILSDQPRKPWTAKKRSKGPKNYLVQHRFLKRPGLCSSTWSGEWRTWGAFSTAKQRDQSLEQLKKSHGSSSIAKWEEWRPLDLEAAQ